MTSAKLLTSPLSANPTGTTISVQKTTETSTTTTESVDYDSYFDDLYSYSEYEEEAADYADTADEDQEDEDIPVSVEDRLIEGLPPDIYCDLIATLKERCGEYSPLDLWKYDEARIRNLTKGEIVEAFNSVFKSPVLGYLTDYR